MSKKYSIDWQRLAAVTCALGLGVCLAAPAAQAGMSKAKVGLGVASVPDYEGSEDSEAYPAVYLDLEWDNGMYVKTVGQGLQANLLPHSTNFRAGLAGHYTKTRDDDVDNNRIAKMKKVDSAFEAGAFVAYDFNPNVEINLEVVTDVSDSHDGTLGTLRLFYTLPHSTQLASKFGLFTTYADGSYMHTYFSVNTETAGTSDMVSRYGTYAADSGIKDFGITYALSYDCTSNWGVIGQLGYKKLTGDASDSPIVDKEGDDSQFTAGIMATYTF